MSTTGDLIGRAFGPDKKLLKRSIEAVGKYPDLDGLFGDISRHVLNLGGAASTQEEQPSKKRKLDNGVNGKDLPNGFWKAGSFSTIKELSFTIPQRKKMNLDIGNTKTGLRASNPTTAEVEFGLGWHDVAQIVCLPVPEKAQPQFNFCVFPTNGDGISGPSDGASMPDQIVWTIPNSTPKPGIFSDDIPIGGDETYRSATINFLNDRLRQSKGHKYKIIEPDRVEFTSGTAQPYKKGGEKAVHVKAFRGSKDGFLFFLPTGIVWGFRKPLIFFSFDSIDSVSYTSVLQRTFNLNVSARGSSSNSEPQEFEFSMLDQGEFAGIDAYVKRHQLQDASMAEQRRAKKFNINGVRGDKDTDDQDEGPGELAKATQEAQELDDSDEEDDENFDPGSEGESEGSGTSDEEEDANEPAIDENAEDDEEEDQL